MSRDGEPADTNGKEDVARQEENDIAETLLMVVKDDPEEFQADKIANARVTPGVKSKIIALICFVLSLYWSYISLIPSSRKHGVGEPERRFAADLVPPVYQTVLISIDGFRHDYLERKNVNGEYIAPTLRSLGHEGAMAAPHGMQPVFPSKTFPNHAAIATGLYPESSGIISNTMYNPLTKTWFHESELDPHWWKGEPIWMTLKRTTRRDAFAKNTRNTTSDKKYITATVFWPGSTIAGRKADAFWMYNASVPYEDRVNRAADLLTGKAADLSDGPADFVTLYFEGVDHAGHQYGPDSEEVDTEIARVDASVANMRRLAPQASIIVVSDHGMTSIRDDRYIDLNKAVTPDSVLRIVTSPVLMVHNLTISSQVLFRKLSNYLKKSSKATAYLKENIPSRWNLRRSPLVPPVIALAELGWTMVFSNQTSRVGLSGDPHSLVRHGANHPVKGAHGYDNTERDMQALFIAAGPAFKRRQRIRHMRAVDVYPLICHMFGADAAPNNGSVHITSHILSFS